MGPLKGAEPIDPAALRPNWDAYYAALGRFMHEFAVAEEEINRIIQDFVIFDQLALPINKQLIAKALLGGFRLAAAKDMLKRLLRVTEASSDVRCKINRILDHLGEIHYMRDRLAHNGAFPSMERAGWFVTTNQIQVREVDQMDWIAFTPDMLMDMAFDLDRIPYLIGITLAPQDERERHASLATTEEERSMILEPHKQPWRHKPSQLVKTGPKYERIPPRRDHQPQPSRASRKARRNKCE